MSGDYREHTGRRAPNLNGCTNSGIIATPDMTEIQAESYEYFPQFFRNSETHDDYRVLENNSSITAAAVQDEGTVFVSQDMCTHLPEQESAQPQCGMVAGPHRDVINKAPYNVEEDWIIAQCRGEDRPTSYHAISQALSCSGYHRTAGALQVHHSQYLSKCRSRMEDISPRKQAIVKRVCENTQQKLFRRVLEESRKGLGHTTFDTKLIDLIQVVLEFELLKVTRRLDRSVNYARSLSHKKKRVRGMK